MNEPEGFDLNQRAPEIDLPDGNGQRWQLSAQRGRAVVLLFYPGDETPVCTKQMCSVRDNWRRYQEAGAEVVGINTDTIEQHQRFSAHHGLPLRLLSDPDGSTVRAYGMKMPLLNKVQRGVVVIDPEGIIRYRRITLPMFRPADADILEAIRKCT
jgi:peroxiredoxin Q/BCP